MSKRSPAAERAARARRHKKMIDGVINRVRHQTWESLFKTYAYENPNGSSGTFNRWFDEAWLKSIKPGAP